MKLSAIELKSGDVLHCTSDSWLQRKIQWFTKSRIGHTALVIEIWGELFIIDSQKDGTNLRPIHEWNAMYNYRYTISRPHEFTDELRHRAMLQIGSTPYDFASLLIWQPLYILTGKWKGKTEEEAMQRMYCSEYVAWVFDLPYWWKLSPEKVYQYMVANPEKFHTFEPS